MLHMVYPILHNVKWRNSAQLRKFVESIYRDIYRTTKHRDVIPSRKKDTAAYVSVKLPHQPL